VNRGEVYAAPGRDTDSRSDVSPATSEEHVANIRVTPPAEAWPPAGASAQAQASRRYRRALIDRLGW
jgi:hypothetical protein